LNINHLSEQRDELLKQSEDREREKQALIQQLTSSEMEASKLSLEVESQSKRVFELDGQLIAFNDREVASERRVKELVSEIKQSHEQLETEKLQNHSTQGKLTEALQKYEALYAEKREKDLSLQQAKNTLLEYEKKMAALQQSNLQAIHHGGSQTAKLKTFQKVAI
jgi:hypothetical protein